MPLSMKLSCWRKAAATCMAACFLCTVVGGSENGTESSMPAGIFQHPTLNTCITEMIRAACDALRPNPIKRNTELINSILGLPRILQEAGR